MFFIFTGGVGSSEDGPVKKAARKLSIRSRKSGKSTSVTPPSSPLLKDNNK